ncbi:MAG TPA: hypothetical protein VL485_22985, partial [Ktedonobacteraceae bacterium]|nr:hypothetical protein [Ktedonobacteraceae bacterium]
TTWHYTKIDHSHASNGMNGTASHLAEASAKLSELLPALKAGMSTMQLVTSQGGQVMVGEASFVESKMSTFTNALNNAGMALEAAALLINELSGNIPAACATGFTPTGPHPMFAGTAFDPAAENGKAYMADTPGTGPGETGGGSASSQEDEALINELASKLHERWQKARNYEPRMKEANDPAWTAAHNGETQLDIANTPYDELPTTWQAENHASAQAALEIVQELRSSGEDLTKLRSVKSALQSGHLQSLSAQGQPGQSLLKAGDLLHKNWLSRNGTWAPEEQKVPFNQLSTEEQDKDLVVILEAVLLLSH